MLKKYLWTFEYRKENPEEELELWVPLPAEKYYQQIFKLDTQVSEGASIQKNRDDEYDFEYLYVRFPAQQTSSLKLSAIVELHQRNNLSASSEVLLPNQSQLYLSSKKHVPLSALVKEFAEKICSGIQNPEDRAKAIYQWVIKNGERDPHQQGCGLGNVEQSLQDGHICGRCVDISSVTVALLRAAGIPARELFGMRLGPASWTKGLGRFGDISEAYHCKVEYWIQGRGWQVCDPGDVLKLMLDEKFDLHSERFQIVSERLFSESDPNWLCFNSGRDLNLKPSTGMLENYFMYPLGLQLGERLSPYEPLSFGFKVTSEET